jgi:hypothetical protein
MKLLKALTWRIALIGLCLTAQDQPTHTERVGAPLGALDRIGDPDPRDASDPLWLLPTSTIPVSPDGYTVFQYGKQVRVVGKNTFDPSAPFCVVAPEAQGAQAAEAEAGLPVGEPLQVSVIGMQPNSIDLGPFHLWTDLLRLRVQRSGGAVVLGFMWPRDGSRDAQVRRGARASELEEILGPKFKIGNGRIASTVKPGTIVFTETTSLVNVDVLVRDAGTNRYLSDLRLDQFRLYEGCVPEEGPRCQTVKELRFSQIEERDVAVNFIVVAEIGNASSSRRATVQEAVSRLVDFTSERDRAAIVAY